MLDFVRVLYVNELGPNDSDIKLLSELEHVKEVVVADYRYRVGDHKENIAYLDDLRKKIADKNSFKPKNYNVSTEELCKFVDRSLNEQVHYYLSKVDCIYIAGSRFDPSSKYCTENPNRINPDIRREQFEIRLLKLAMDLGIPTLVVCAGMWRIASAFGVRTTALPEDTVRSHHEQWKTVRYPDKNTMLVPGTTLQRLHSMAQNKVSFNLLVNSTHWRAVPPPETQASWTDYNKRFITTAWDSKYGNVEALEAKNNAQLWGKQWHKEQVDPGSEHYETHRKILEDLLVKGGMFFSKKREVCKEIKSKTLQFKPVRNMAKL